MARELAVGIALSTDPERTRDKLARFCRGIAAASGLSVKAHGMFHYHHLITALEQGKLDLVWLPPLLALRSTGRGLVTPLALPVRHGVSTYSTALFTRPDSNIHTIADLDGVSAAWVDPHSASGYLVIRALLRSKGVDLGTAFGSNTFAGAHAAVVKLVLAGHADVGATFAYFEDDSSSAALKSAGWQDAEVRVICVAGSIPSDMIAAREGLDPATHAVVQRALVSGEDGDLALAAGDLLGAEGFVAPSEAHLDALSEILRGLEDEATSTRPYSILAPRGD
jgi:phosphonate transport system substrate-binding protein